MYSSIPLYRHAWGAQLVIGASDAATDVDFSKGSWNFKVAVVVVVAAAVVRANRREDFDFSGGSYGYT